MTSRAAIGLILASAAVVSTTSSDSAATPPPTSKCWATAHPSVTFYSKPPPEHRFGRKYNVICKVPGVRQSDMFEVSRQCAKGAAALAGYKNEVASDYAPFGISPRPGKATFFEQRANETHIVVEMGADATAGQIAKYCTKVNQSGVLAKGQNMDREYRCKVHIMNSERNKAQEVGRLLMTSEMLTEARAAHLRVCLLPSTDIQCAPCTSSDKLVVRVSSVAKGTLCPAGTIGWVE